MQKKPRLLKKEIKKWIKEYDALDVIVFGSTMRGNLAPKDLDFCILIRDADEKKSLDLVDSLGRVIDAHKIKAHISILSASAFVQGDSLARTLLSEGYSLKRDKGFSLLFGSKNKSLFVYTLKHFSSSKRVKFHYLLRGRHGSPGILKEVNGTMLGAGVILVPKENEDLFKDIFDKWGVKYSVIHTLIEH